MNHPCSKMRFATRAEAKAWVRGRSTSRNSELTGVRPYWHDQCQAFHLTSMTKRQARARGLKDRTVTAPTIRRCPNCGMLFEDDTPIEQQRSATPKVYCQDKCARAAKRWRHQMRYEAALAGDGCESGQQTLD
jgi:hypothetical protein